MIDIYLIALAVFFGVVIVLVGALLFVESRVVLKGDRKIEINDDPDKSITAPTSATLLSALNQNSIWLPSACGGNEIERSGMAAPLSVPASRRDRHTRRSFTAGCQLPSLGSTET